MEDNSKVDLNDTICNYVQLEYGNMADCFEERKFFGQLINCHFLNKNSICWFGGVPGSIPGITRFS
jgi:hypothetical protein